MYEVAENTGILTECNRNVKTIFSNFTFNEPFLKKIFFWKFKSGKFRPKSGEIQFPVTVKLEPEQGFEISVPDIPELECQKYFPVPVTRTGIVFGQFRFFGFGS